eukprot:jgi/Ulvmu1/12177/UM085_0041.1
MCKISPSDSLNLYRQLLRLCSSFSSTETLYFRDPIDNAGRFLRYDLKGAAIRSLTHWLREKEPEVTSQVQAGVDVQSSALPLPYMPPSMTFTKADLLQCVRQNFRKDCENVRTLTPEKQQVARELLGLRGFFLGVYLESQINLHKMSSVTTTSFQALLPADMTNAKHRCQASSTSLDAEAASAASSDMTAEADSSVSVDVDGVTAEEWLQGGDRHNGSVAEATSENDLQRLQHRLDSVQQIYKGRNPLVGSANEFEALCMTAMQPADSSLGDNPADVATGTTQADLVTAVSRLRIHAVPFTASTRNAEDGEARRSSPDDHLPVSFQVIVENIGGAAVQLMGRWYQVTAPWESKSVGKRGQPHGHASHGVLVMPGEVVMEQQAIMIRGAEGEIAGGFLCRALPMDIAEDIAKLYPPAKLDASEPINMSELDPDTYFLAEFGPCKIRSSHLLKGEFAQRLTGATDDSDADDASDNDQGSDEEDDEDSEELTLEVLTDKGSS